MSEEAKTAEISRLIDAYGNMLLRLCAQYLGDTALAEDALQETYLRAYRFLDSYGRKGSELAWLSSIAINCCRNLRRGAWFQRVKLGLPLDILRSQEGDPENWDDTVICQVSQLPPKYREIILLYYYQEMNTREIALALKLPEPTVSTRLRRARERLRPGLERWYFDD